MKAVVVAVLLLVATVYAKNKCPSAQETDWSIELLLRHEDCDKFYKCTYGQPVEQFCYNGLYFNLETWQCDWQHNVDCAGRNIPGDSDEESAPEPKPEQEVEVVPEPEHPEPEPEQEVEVVPEPEHPEPEPEQEVEVVPKPELPEPEPEQEEVAPEEPECEPEVPEEPEVVPEPEEEKPEIEFLENGCPVNPHVHWLLPHERDCNKFYYCVWGEKVLRECSSTLHFNRVLQVCDWPTHAGCDTSSNGAELSANKHYSARRVYRNMV